MRFLEFLREPEALFWVFIFPLLLAAGLGLAFRNRPPEVLGIAAVTPGLANSLRREKLLDVREMDPAAGEQALRTGKVALLVAPGPHGEVTYRYDDTNAEGRTARMLAEQAVEQAAGRADPVASRDLPMREPGSRYIDFLIPGLLGMNLMGSAIWGMGFTIVDARRKNLIKRLIATPMPRYTYLASFALSRIVLLVVEVAVLLGFGAAVFRVPVRGSLLTRRPVSSGFIHLQRHWIADGLARSHYRGRLGPHESGDDAHVDRLRRVFLRAALSRRAATPHQGLAFDRGDRRAPRQHAAGRQSRSGGAADRHPRPLADRVLCARFEIISLAIGSGRLPDNVYQTTTPLRPACGPLVTRIHALLGDRVGRLVILST